MRFWSRLDGPQKTVTGLVGIVIFMAAMAWAAIPMYSLFCKVTGYGGTTNSAKAGSDLILDKTITVRFDGMVDKDMPWVFKPAQRSMTLRIGETGLAFYTAHNPTDHPVAGQAAYNVTPYAAGSYFDKIQCFCFTEQVLQPGETVEMPVSFYVDPAIVDDPEGKYVHTITLSYTFYQIDLPKDDAQAAAAPSQTAPALTTPPQVGIDTN